VDKVLILDFGSQTTQLIGRRVRELGVYADIVPGDIAYGHGLLADVKALILSGSPFSVYEEGAPAPDPRFYSCGLPVLGICYGIQRMTEDLGGKVSALKEREYGRIQVGRPADDEAAGLLKGIPGAFTAWMSHGDSIERPAPGFAVHARSDNDFPAVLKHEALPLWGVQFHPEVTHCEHGNEILSNFVLGISGARREWTMERYVEEVRSALRARVGNKPVLLLISGGVDSTVAGALLLKTLDPEQVYLMYIDTGLMRKDETEGVKRTLERLGASHLSIIRAEEEFLSGLAGLSEPEAKRKAIGDLFIRIQEREVAKLGLEDAFLAQGTLYTDLIESGKGVGKKAHVIKSHHNVRTPLVEKKREAGLVIEPLDRLYKDEVRALGRLLGVDEDVVRRHPFPGPGLGVRILGEITKEKCDILREADFIFIDQLKKRGLYDKIWQAFCVLLPVRSVGVAGDVRKYGYVTALRAIVSRDGMTADVYPFETIDLLEISTMITNSVKDIGRVVYDISSKPPATIEWE
jgi:GMP synthase (glutamine-hydrolysing)